MKRWTLVSIICLESTLVFKNGNQPERRRIRQQKHEKGKISQELSVASQLGAINQYKGCVYRKAAVFAKTGKFLK
jgi:hypothetical protein